MRLKRKALTRAEAREAASYALGDVVRFSRDYAAKGVRRGESFAIAAVDPERGPHRSGSPRWPNA